MKFSAKDGNGPVNKCVKFCWRSGYRDCFMDSILLGDRESLTALHAACSITGARYRNTGETGLGGCMHCPSASSFNVNPKSTIKCVMSFSSGR